MLREKFFLHTLELSFNALDLLPCAVALGSIEFGCLRAGEPPMGPIHNRRDHLQVADQFGGGLGRRFLLPLRFEKQRRIVQNPLANRGRSPTPGAIQLPGFACIAVMLSKDRGHALAGLQALARHRHQKLHRHLRRDLSFPHLLLDRLRQQFRQRQPPRHPTHTAIELARQFIQSVAEALLHLRQQPAHLQRGLVFG